MYIKFDTQLTANTLDTGFKGRIQRVRDRDGGRSVGVCHLCRSLEVSICTDQSDGALLGRGRPREH